MNSLIHRILPILRSHKEIIALFILTSAFFYPVIIHYDQMLYPPGDVSGNDITGMWSFYRSFFGATVQNTGNIPLWNPYTFSGTPFIGNPQAQLFCPFVWPFIAVNSSLLFGWLCILEIFLIGVFSFLFARSLCLSKFASFFSAVVFMFSGTIILRIYAGHLPILDTLVWFPLVLLFFERSFTHNRIVHAILAGIAMALMVFSGHFQVALYGIFICLVYLFARTFLFPTLPTFREKLRHIAIMVLIPVLLCALLSAVLVLPVEEYSQWSNRAGDVSYRFSTEFSLPVENLITLVLPDIHGNPLGPVTQIHVNPPVEYWEFAWYMGILPLFLLVIAAFFQRKRHVGLLLFLALFALLFSLGANFPLYKIFFDYIPGFSMFRVPARMLFVCTFFLAILAGFGIDALLDDRKSEKRRFISIFGTRSLNLACIVIAAVSGIILLLSSLTGILARDYYLLSVFGWTAFVTLFCIAPVVLNSSTPSVSRKDLVKILLIGMLILDLFFFGMRFIDTKSPQEVFRNPEYIPVIANETDTYYRVYDETEYLNQYQYVAYQNNLHLISGYDPTYLREYQAYFIRSQQEDYSGYYLWMQGAVISDFDILRSLNVRYIITTRNYADDFAVSGLECVYYNNSVRVYRLNVTAPRAYVIPSLEFTNTTPVSLQPARIEQYTPNAIRVNVTTEEPGYLVLSEIYYPGWSVQDNGKTSTVERYNGIFRAVYLDPGTHRVLFTYFPKSLTL